MENDIYLSVIVPVYNEDKLIKSTLLEIERFLAGQNFNYEIIVVDDGSNSKTITILKDLEATLKNYCFVSNDRNRGKGYSVRRGMLMANGKFRLFMDADNSTHIDQIVSFMPFLEGGYDVAIGDRTLERSMILKHQPAHKKILGNIGNIFIKMLAVPYIKDTQCGFKCFSGKFVEKVFPLLKIDRWGFDIEILTLANKFGFKIKTVPIIWKNRKDSRVRLVDYVLTLCELFQIKINLMKKIYDSRK
ncbi:MAG: dolichyl-phosphate beta-glucosyltransferase [Minisyncoccia bacterium]